MAPTGQSRPRPSRGITATLALVSLLAACGQGPGTLPPASVAAVASAAPPPTSLASRLPTDPPMIQPDLAGKFDVGGHSLYIECFGTSGPVMLLETGSGSPSVTWRRSPMDFMDLLDNSYRRCIYDRANIGRSDKSSIPRTSATAAAELHALLVAAGLPGPYVLVGRSFGGYNVRLFAASYPDDVRALILLESLTPEFHRGLEQLLTPEQWAMEVAGVQSYERPLDVIASTPLVEDAKLPDVPLLVIAGTKWHGGNEPWPAGWPAQALDALWDRAQIDLAASVEGGRLVVFEGGDHSLQTSEPDRLADEINHFLAGLTR
jgi:pimeloyl-ACP methyl ester carboxylesterase